MSNLYVAYYFPNRPQTADSIARRLEDVGEYYNADSSDRVDNFVHAGPLTGLAFWTQKFDNVRLRFCQTAGARTVVSMHLPFGISELTPLDADTLDTCLLTAHDQLWTDLQKLAHLHPPLCLSSIETARDELTIITDGLGLTRLYQFNCGDGIVWSNRISAAIVFAREVPSLSREGWSTQAVSGWFLDRHTPYERITVVRPGAFIKVDGRAPSLSCRHANCLHEWITRSAKPPVHPNAAFGRMLRELRSFGDFTPISAGLSGGRDSRVICSFLCRNLQPDELQLYTNYPPLLEKVIAEKLVGKLDRPIPWKATERTRRILDDSILDRAQAWIKLYDGMIIADFLYMRPTFPTWFRKSARVQVGLGGEGAELARAYGYTAQHLRNTPFETRLKSHPLTSFIWNAPFVHEDCRESCKQILDAYIDEARFHGVAGYAFFDYWYFLTRFSQAAVLGCGFTHLAPFASPEFIRAGFALSSADRFNAQLHRDIIRMNQPRWSSEPFFSDLQNSVDKELVQGLGPRTHIWDSSNADEFREMIESEAHLGDVYNLNDVRACYNAPDEMEPASRDRLNKIAYNMVMKYALVEYRQTLVDYVASPVSERARCPRECEAPLLP